MAAAAEVVATTKRFIKGDYFFAITNVPQITITARNRLTDQVFEVVNPPGVRAPVVQRADERTVTIEGHEEQSLQIEVDGLVMVRLPLLDATEVKVLQLKMEEMVLKQLQMEWRQQQIDLERERREQEQERRHQDTQRELIQLRGDLNGILQRLNAEEDRSAHEVSFTVKLNAFSPQYACLPLCRGQPYPQWVWAFYVFGHSAHPYRAGQLQVYGFVESNRQQHQILSPSFTLNLGQQHTIRWRYSERNGGELWVDGNYVGVVGYLGALDTSRAARNAVAINNRLHGNHTQIDGIVNNIVLNEPR